MERTKKYCVFFLILYLIYSVAICSFGFFLRSNNLDYALLLIGNSGPAVFLLIVVLLSSYIFKKRKAFICSFIFIFILAIVVSFLTNLWAKERFRYIIDCNATNYTDYLESDVEFHYTPRFANHFPRSIPKEAKNISFFRGRTLDLTLFQIRFNLPKEMISNIRNTWASSAIHRQFGCTKRSKTDKKVYIFTEFRNRENTSFEPLSNDFEVLIFQTGWENLPQKPLLSEWQTNYSCGMAINVKTCEIIYWATHPGY